MNQELKTYVWTLPEGWKIKNWWENLPRPGEPPFETELTVEGSSEMAKLTISPLIEGVLLYRFENVDWPVGEKTLRMEIRAQKVHERNSE